MVTGIDSFKEWFKGSEEQYAIIGGTACDILMTEDGLDFRATKLLCDKAFWLKDGKLIQLRDMSEYTAYRDIRR